MDISPVKIVALAKIVHEANKAYCECIGDNSQLPWEETSGAIKNTTIEGVERIIDNPNITSEEIHDSWVENKKRDGWVYGEVKSEEDKTHPCLVPYDELSAQQKFKDALFISIVLTYLQSLGVVEV